MKTIYILEDDDNIRELISYALKNSGFNAKDFADSASLFKDLKTTKEIPDLLLLDVTLPDKNGFEILEEFRREDAYHLMPIIMLTAMASEADKIKGLNLGADDYITKPFSVIEMVARIDAVLRRVSNTEKTDEVIIYKDIVMNNKKHLVTVANEPVVLTYMEYELLKYLMSNPNIVLSRLNIMDVVWNAQYNPESRTVDMHIRSLRMKLKHAGDYIKTVRNIGYKIGD